MTNSTIAPVASPATVAEVTVKPVPASRELSNAGRKAAAELSKARADVKAAKERAEAAEAVILAELDGARKGTVGGMTVVRLQAGSNSHFDRDVLATAYPEAFTAALRKTTYDSIRTL
jgi:hypothetical protein